MCNSEIMLQIIMWTYLLAGCFVQVSFGIQEISLLQKPTSQSSRNENSYLAVDSGTATNFPSGSCTHTENEIAWWKVDMGSEYCVTKVSILNRSDCCGERLLGSIVRVGSSTDTTQNTQCGSSITSAPGGAWTHIICAQPRPGRYISVHVNGGAVGTLTMCEVKAYEETCPTTTVAPSTQVKTTTTDRVRDDGRCGPSYPAPYGGEGECDGCGIHPCCSTLGYCGNTADHCVSLLHKDYSSASCANGETTTITATKTVTSDKDTTTEKLQTTTAAHTTKGATSTSITTDDETTAARHQTTTAAPTPTLATTSITTDRETTTEKIHSSAAAHTTAKSSARITTTEEATTEEPHTYTTVPKTTGAKTSSMKTYQETTETLQTSAELPLTTTTPVSNSEDLANLFDSIETTIEIPDNATEEEVVQLIQEQSETAIKYISEMATSSNGTDTSVLQTNPAQLTEGTEALLQNLASYMPPGGSVKVTTETMVAEARSFTTDDGALGTASFTVAGDTSSRAPGSPAKATLDVPLDTLNGVKGTITATLVFVDHSILGSSNVSVESPSNERNQSDTEDADVTTSLSSGILTFSLYVDGNKFSLATKLMLQYNEEVPNSHPGYETQSETICAFYDTRMSTWSIDGCDKVTQTDNQVSCSCNHTTSYAVLLQLTQQPIPEFHSDLMTYLTKTGCYLSIFSLAASFAIFMSFESLRTAEFYIIHSNFAAALFLAQLLFLLGADQVTFENLCRFIGMTIHYLYLCVFCWMLVEGINLYIKIVLVFNTEKSKLLYYILIGWGVPVLIVAVCAGAAWDQYSSQNSCWIRGGSPLIWGFAGPAAVTILANLILLCIVARILYRSVDSMDKDGNKKLKASWAAVKGTFTLTPLLGVTWIFGFLAVGDATLVFQYIFVVLNSLQGVFFFIFFCFLNKEVREKLRRFSEKMKLSSGQFSSSVAPDKTMSENYST